MSSFHVLVMNIQEMVFNELLDGIECRLLGLGEHFFKTGHQALSLSPNMILIFFQKVCIRLSPMKLQFSSHLQTHIAVHLQTQDSLASTAFHWHALKGKWFPARMISNLSQSMAASESYISLFYELYNHFSYWGGRESERMNFK